MKRAVSTASGSFIASAIKSSIAQNSLPAGKSLHAHVIKSGYLQETILCNHLLNMYCKCHLPIDARKLFEEMPERNLISYSTLISTNARSGDPGLALRFMAELHKLALEPNQFVFSSSVVACSKLKSVALGEQIHAQVIVSGFGSDPYVNTNLIDMYSKIGHPESTVSVFRQCSVRDPIMFNSMVSSYVSFGAYEEALWLFGEARRSFDCKPTEYSFGSLIKACSELERKVGEQLHVLIMKTGFDSNCFVGTSLVDMYGRLGDIEGLEKVFSGILFDDVALYNALIGAYTKNGLEEIGIQYFNKVMLEDLGPNECTFSSALKAFGGLKSFNLGRMIHGVVEKSRFRQDLVVNTSLIDMYMKCGKVEDGCKVFDYMHERNTISYNALISGHGTNGNVVEAVALFIDMNRQHLDVDLATFVTLMTSCCGHEWNIYVHAIKHGLGSDLMVKNALLDGLLKKGAVDEALHFFWKMKERNVISWTTIISGLTQLDFHSDAIELFKALCSSEVYPNSFTFSSVLKACGNLTSVEQGRCVHACSIKHGAMDDFTSSALLDMYAKCGTLEDGRRLFHILTNKDIVSWNTLISGYAQHGYAHEALDLYAKMGEHNIVPNHVTFVSLLSACSHCGLVESGVQIFDQMVSKYGVVPCMEHYACMVDLFGRAGMLEKARLFINKMPFKADASVWTVFLASCKLHGSVELAQIARDHVMRMQGEESPTLVLMSNMYSQVGKWDDAESARRRMEEGTRKEPGLSWVQITKESASTYGVI